MGAAAGAGGSALGAFLLGPFTPWSDPISEYPAKAGGRNGQLQIHFNGVQFTTGLWFKRVHYHQIQSVTAREGFLLRDNLVLRSVDETYHYTLPRNCNVVEIAEDIAQQLTKRGSFRRLSTSPQTLWWISRGMEIYRRMTVRSGRG